MKKKLMLFPILALLLLSVPMAMAGTVYIEGDGTYSQTTAFSDVSDSVTLTGKWIFESNWGYGSGPDIDNIITLYAGATFFEHAISPRGYYYDEGYVYDHSDESANPGLDLQTIVTCPASNIQDIADIKVRGYDFTFDATAGSYTSTKYLTIVDSYESFSDGIGPGPDHDPYCYMDESKFTVIDTTDSAYVVGGSIKYQEWSYNQPLTFGKLYLTQTFAQGSHTSNIDSRHTTSGWVRPTAFFGEGHVAGEAIVFDWYGTVTEDAHTTDIYYARFVDDTAHIWLLYGKPLVPNDPVNSIILDAYSNVGNFYAEGSALDVDLWEFTGIDLYRADGTTQYLNVPGHAPEGWTANLDMEVTP